MGHFSLCFVKDWQLGSFRFPIYRSAVVFNLLIIQFVGILMSLKRLSSDWEDGDGSEVPRQESKRRLALAGGIVKGLSMQEFVIQLKLFFRNLMQEKAERKILPFSHPSPRSSLNRLEPSHARNLQLHFVDKLPPTLFTGNKIESECYRPVEIVIIDAVTKNRATSLPLPSIKVEIVVLDGDFGPDDQEDWTEQEFNAKVVREREGKRPLVTGECVVTLKGGAGSISDVSFTDNSKWIRSGKFRLGARAVPSISTELRIREAKSNAFVVKDGFGKSYQKHSLPNLSDEIWRLKKIAKDGKFHERLASKGIKTVKDFLQFYYVDPSSLRNILGCGVFNKTWETIVEHATACVLDNQLYMYSRDAERFGILLNSVYKVVGAVFDGQIYEPLDKLDALQKGLVENLKTRAYKNLKMHAYENLGDLVHLDEPPVFGPGMVPSCLQPTNFPGVHQDQQNMLLASNHVETSQPYLYNQQDQFQLEVSVEQHSHPMQFFPPTSTHNLMSIDSYSPPYGEENSWAPGGSLGPLMQIGNQTADDSFQIDELFFSPSNEAVEFLSSDFGFDISRNERPKLSGVRDALKGLSIQEFVMKSEPFSRNLVREELKRKILLFSHPSPRSSLNRLEPSHARNLQLHFVDKLPPTLFTGNKIESECNQPIEIVIIDAVTKNRATSLPLPSIKVEIVVLDGDFGPDDQEDWTEQEFNAKVVREREGKRPLVTGECVVKLKGGAGSISDVSFTDNSKWIRSGKFRLGARAVPSISTELRIREAKSNAFVVKDGRGKLYQKHQPPRFSDEIWRLDKIAKDGKFHERLASKGIETVKDFLRFYHVDPSLLHNMLGGGVLNKTWETIVEYATACVLDNQLYMYSRDAERFGILLNSVYKVVGAVFDGQIYAPLDKLNALQKGLVENLKRDAYKNLGDLVPINEPPVFQIETPFWNMDELFFSPSNRKPKLGWGVIRAVMKFVISVRRDVAAKKCLDFLPESSNCR